MHRTFHFLLAAGALLLASCSSMKKTAARTPGKPDIGNIKACQYTATVRANYSLFLPEGYDARSSKRWPTILFLHGSGERGTNVWRASIHGPTKYIAQHPDFPFILISPQCPLGQKWSDETVLGILDSVVQKYAVDTNRIYLTGLSMGGYGAWSLATTYPERFAAVAPMCGGEGNIGVVLSLVDKTKARALKQLPVWVFHGGKDKVVSPEESKRMIKILKDAGDPNVKLTIYPNTGHPAWTQAYNSPELYEWFLEHQLGPAK